jgi:hypothetical protein
VVTPGEARWEGDRGVPIRHVERRNVASRRTRVVLSIPWDDETEDHPSAWGYDVLLNRALPDSEVYVIDFAEVEAPNNNE